MRCGQIVLGWGRGLSAWCLKEFLLKLFLFPVASVQFRQQNLKGCSSQSYGKQVRPYQFIVSLLKLFKEHWVALQLKKKKKIEDRGRAERGVKKALLPNCDLNWDWHQQTFPHQPLAHLVQTKQIEDLFCQWDHLAFLFMLQKEPVPVSHQSTRLLVAGLCCSFWLALIWDF